MKILQLHNFYRIPGGEDSVVQAEYNLLHRYGHEVVQHTVHNNAITQISGLAAAAKTVWNHEAYRTLRKLMRDCKPDVLHAHNTFPLLSPAVYYAAWREGVPVVQTLHNYRLLCPAATFFRQGEICEDCLGRFPLPGVVHRCYRGSLGASAAVTAMLGTHRALGTWTRRVDIYLCLTEFAKERFTKLGIPAERLRVKPNCLAVDPDVGSGSGGYALFAGRATREKGLHLLIESWMSRRPAMKLKIAGSGPLLQWAQEAASGDPNIEVLGACSPGQVIDLMREAAFLVVPSIWYEVLPMSIVESFAVGTPVIASKLPSLDGIVEDGINGLRFANSPGELGDVIQEMASASPERIRDMRRAARQSYERSFTAECNHAMLMDAYTGAKNLRQQAMQPRPATSR